MCSNMNICESCRYFTFDMGGGRACFIASCDNNSEYEIDPMLSDFMNNRNLKEIYIKGDPEKWEEIKKILNRPES